MLLPSASQRAVSLEAGIILGKLPPQNISLLLKTWAPILVGWHLDPAQEALSTWSAHTNPGLHVQEKP